LISDDIDTFRRSSSSEVFEDRTKSLNIQLHLLAAFDAFDAAGGARTGRTGASDDCERVEEEEYIPGESPLPERTGRNGGGGREGRRG